MQMQVTIGHPKCTVKLIAKVQTAAAGEQREWREDSRYHRQRGEDRAEKIAVEEILSRPWDGLEGGGKRTKLAGGASTAEINWSGESMAMEEKLHKKMKNRHTDNAFVAAGDLSHRDR